MKSAGLTPPHTQSLMVAPLAAIHSLKFSTTTTPPPGNDISRLWPTSVPCTSRNEQASRSASPGATASVRRSPVGRDRHVDDMHVRIGQLANRRRRRLAQLRDVDHSTLRPRGLSARRRPFLVTLNHGHAAVLEGDLEVAVLRLDLGHVGRVEVQLQAVARRDQLDRGTERGLGDLDLVAGLGQLGFGRLVRGGEEWVSDRVPVESVIFALQSFVPWCRTDWRAQTDCPQLPNQHAKDLFFVQYVLVANLVKMPSITQSIRRPDPYTPV